MKLKKQETAREEQGRSGSIPSTLPGLLRAGTGGASLVCRAVGRKGDTRAGLDWLGSELWAGDVPGSVLRVASGRVPPAKGRHAQSLFSWPLSLHECAHPRQRLTLLTPRVGENHHSSSSVVTGPSSLAGATPQVVTRVDVVQVYRSPLNILVGN